MLKNKLSHLWAACCMFTRIPLWKIWSAPIDSYPYAVHHWMIAGGLVAALWAAFVFFLIYPWFPESITVLVLIIGSLFISGGFHEDGLADFFDGFGGGMTKDRILEIMKDSHIGTYGVISLILYFLLLFFTLHAMTPIDAAMTIAAVDPFAKMLSAQLIQMMPYARTEETAKNHTVYRRFDIKAGISLAIQGLLPISLYIYYMYARIDWQLLIFIPAIVMYFLYMLIWRRLHGYTGDCCGALFLLTELTTLLVAGYYLQ